MSDFKKGASKNFYLDFLIQCIFSFISCSDVAPDLQKVREIIRDYLLSRQDKTFAGSFEQFVVVDLWVKDN